MCSGLTGTIYALDDELNNAAHLIFVHPGLVAMVARSDMLRDDGCRSENLRGTRAHVP
jgi:hypothetical protein